MVVAAEPGARDEQAADVVAVLRAAAIARGGRSDQDQTRRRRGKGDQAPTKTGYVGHQRGRL